MCKDKQPGALKMQHLKWKRPCFTGRTTVFQLPFRLTCNFQIFRFQKIWLTTNKFPFVFSSLNVWLDYQQKNKFLFFLLKKYLTAQHLPRTGSRRLTYRTPTKQAKKKRNIITHIITEQCCLIKIIIYAQLQCSSSFTSPAFHKVFLAGLIKISRILLDI